MGDSKYFTEVAEKYDSYESIEHCRYIRRREQDKYEANPFCYEEIFGKKNAS